MATKDTSSRNTEKVAAKRSNEERVALRVKRLAAESMASHSEIRPFGS
jgi:hypothetical protein